MYEGPEWDRCLHVDNGVTCHRQEGHKEWGQDHEGE